MDPLTLAGSFATVVGLLANFKAERSGATLEDFMQWMRETHQESLASSIEQNDRLQQAIGTLLGKNHEELVAELQSITGQLAAIAGQVDGFSEIASAISSTPVLSQQALCVLRQIAASPAKFVMQHKSLDGTNYLLMDGATGKIQATEPRFIEEDFDALVAAGFLRVEFTSKGTPRYFITRSGSSAGSAA